MIPAAAILRWGGDPARPEAEKTLGAVASLCEYVGALFMLAEGRLEAHERRARGTGDHAALRLLDEAGAMLRDLGGRLQDDPTELEQVLAELDHWIAKLEASPGALAELRRVASNAHLAMLPEELDPMPPEESARRAAQASPRAKAKHRRKA